MRHFVLLIALLAFGEAAVAAPQTVRDCRDCPDMVVVPPGTFPAGSAPGEIAREHVDAALAAREQPQVDIRLQAFAIARHDVTRADFARFVAETGHEAGGPCSVLKDGPSNAWGPDPYADWHHPGFAQSEDDPVVCVTYADAVAYAAWMSRKTGRHYRLPSGTEWEYAARAGAKTARFWGDDTVAACAYANVSGRERAEAHNGGNADPMRFLPCADGFVETSPVGKFKPNAWRLFDRRATSGNGRRIAWKQRLRVHPATAGRIPQAIAVRIWIAAAPGRTRQSICASPHVTPI